VRHLVPGDLFHDPKLVHPQTSSVQFPAHESPTQNLEHTGDGPSDAHDVCKGAEVSVDGQEKARQTGHRNPEPTYEAEFSPK